MDRKEIKRKMMGTMFGIYPEDGDDPRVGSGIKFRPNTIVVVETAFYNEITKEVTNVKSYTFDEIDFGMYYIEPIWRLEFGSIFRPHGVESLIDVMEVFWHDFSKYNNAKSKGEHPTMRPLISFKLYDNYPRYRNLMVEAVEPLYWSTDTTNPTKPKCHNDMVVVFVEDKFMTFKEIDENERSTKEKQAYAQRQQAETERRAQIEADKMNNADFENKRNDDIEALRRGEL